ncbi:MAG: NAD-dependent epimerase/dehydratase family protein [Bacteriovorax sp.]|nr:NAD-dependent epimerase/dehydratase family protein [Bacteriovorax sp.]
MSKILVTGGAGFIGSNFCNLMVKKGHDVTAFDNLSLGVKENLVPEVKLVVGDVKNRVELESAGMDFEYIVHLAASSSAPMFVDHLRDSMENNIMGHLDVLNFARDIKAKKVMFASTSSIYGNNPTPLTEDQFVLPPNFYSVTKHSQESTSRVYSKVYDLEIIAFRFMSVYGPNEGHKKIFANVLSQFIWGMKMGKPAILYGDGTQERDFTNVRDVVQGIELAMNSEKKYGFNIFNIGTAEAINLIELVKIINKVMGTSIEPQCIENPIKSGYIKTQLAGIEKISNELGFKPMVGLEEGIKEIVDNLDPSRIPLMQE